MKRHNREHTLPLLGLAFVASSLALRPANVISTMDIWYHLAAGEWIYLHGAAPTLEPFGRHAEPFHWVAYSWLFEVCIYVLYKSFGLVGIFIYTCALSVGITFVLYRLVGLYESRPAYAALYTAIFLFSIERNLIPRPWLFTILFFTIELYALLSARKARRYGRLWLLVPLFALWANIHIQFVHGLFVLGIFAVTPLFLRRLRNDADPLPSLQALAVPLACFLATFINPYHFRLYSIVVDFIRKPEHFKLLYDFEPLHFRSWQEWLLLFTALGAVYVAGRKKLTDPFLGGLFVTCAYLSFHSWRDGWFVAIAAVIVLAASLGDGAGLPQIKPLHTLGLTIGAVVVALLMAATYGVNNPRLQEIVEAALPARAVRFVSERGIQGPLYNFWNWGGYLAWHLRMPVAMYTCSNAFSDEQVTRNLNTWRGAPGWRDDPELNSARLVIAPKQTALTALLREDPRFEVTYEDGVSVVFVSRVR